MSKLKFRIASLCIALALISLPAWAGIEGTISGTVYDNQGVAVSGAAVQLLTTDGQKIKETTSSPTGEFQFFPVNFGDYEISVLLAGFAPYHAAVHVESGATSQADAHLEPQAAGKEMVIEVKAKKKHLIQSSASTSSTQIGKKEISELPLGNQITLPKLISSTTPGVVRGPFGQMFIRGNHANIQYQIDGVQLPESPSNTFGEAFSPRNIDHMEVITGGIPAEYGERLAAVVNIITKSGPETPGGELQLNYGTYNTFSPQLLYGGSNESGTFHYFLSGNYHQTDRGLDTPQPVSETDQTQGGTDAIHDRASGNNEFVKLDWLPNNEDKFSFVFFNAENNFQIPNYPQSFQPTDPFFQATFVDQFGNSGANGTPLFNYVPFNTDDNQFEANAYAQVIWKHTFSERSFLQVAPYYKYSAIHVTNDPINDLASESLTSPGATTQGATPIAGSTPSSFAENRHVNNVGLKTDYTLRSNERNLIKTGFQIQASRAEGPISIQTDLGTPPVVDATPDNVYFEAAYLQDDFTIAKPLILNIGLRYDAIQYSFGTNTTDSLAQPRIGLNYMVTDTTKLHVFYGKLFQPAPAENLRDTFLSTGAGSCPAGQLCPYDIKAEKDDYYEAGVAQQIGDRHAVMVNAYYKDATNMLDDAQLLNTSIAQPYNFATGYAYGLELTVSGQIAEDFSDYLNYSYEIARGKGLSGGIFTGVVPSSDYQYLDHVQLHTANAGLTYAKNNLTTTVQALFGSGLRTGSNNSQSLPSHLTFDATLGYQFKGDSWLSRFNLAGDVLNIFNNVYPVTIANGYNGSHYAAGREFFLRLTKEL